MPYYVLKLQSLRVMPVWECRVGQASEALEWFTWREAGLAPHSRATGWRRMNEFRMSSKGDVHMLALVRRSDKCVIREPIYVWGKYDEAFKKMCFEKVTPTHSCC